MDKIRTYLKNDKNHTTEERVTINKKGGSRGINSITLLRRWDCHEITGTAN